MAVARRSSSPARYNRWSGRSNLLCLPVRHSLSLPSDAAQPAQVPRAKEDARELYAAVESVYPLYETTRQEGDEWPVGGPTPLWETLRGEIDPVDSKNGNESIKYYFPNLSNP